ncbi:MAG: hypothetical protein GY940_19020, partial [bacterium]|nr:hypothetical protein [bacterium]
MPGFEAIIGQDRPIRILTTFLQNGTIPHALLFTGIEGVGKKSTAVTFAMACNCSGNESEGKDNRTADGHSTPIRPRIINPCGNCKSCRKIESENHPDIIRLK